ncbi:MAG: secondary thiamine-phosphate synthase enzyme YjbQ [Desulfarculaceae bacterium]|nr:secondary thiamine-phosphate synthase enzyme YjbQ [Desulfarculaceae bacterium]MCF8049089.1 secondary thiamine-phosphate synthase enzyme YjbQ [Desulfarculaceae bacterium]MCF8064688.1 secondary thiamine-phosphate synthase enzyme YjbQ [Desulfarculaceae bacterium]MCF8099509.1 secondary thiamine-phosphate synthase enzyme YjbQ [Desulfarculaceae bacterium]MCF8122031.1 secondary thiamine-phosphate synthase enzyme YjbQ [Desulfarculaceae bacterium]
MAIYRRILELDGTADTDIHEVTGQVAKVAADSGLDQGSVLVFTPGSTAAVTTIEYESGALSDLGRLLETLAPAGGEYAHNQRWGDGNGYSHLRSALVGPSLTVPLEAGGLMLGTWQQIVVLDFDNRPRRRKVVVTVQGE